MVVILDTGFAIAVRNEDDINHSKAIKAMEECLKGKYGRIIVSNFVFDETITLAMVRTRNKKLIEDLGRFIFDSPRIKLVHLGENEFQASWELFLKYFDQELSFTDCSIIALANLFQKNVYVATVDRHFQGLVQIVPELF